MENIRDKNIGLAFGGGVALGIAHIGVLKAFNEYNLPIKCVAGTSVGALIAAFVAFGKSWDEMSEIAQELRWLDITDFTFSKLGLLSNKKIESLLEKHLGDAMFEDADIPLSIITTDISNGERVILDSGLVSQAVMASTCVPGVFVPVEIEDRMLVDGAIVENVPLSPLKSLGADFIVAIDLSISRNPKKPTNVVEVLLLSLHHAIMRNVQTSSIIPDLIIAPDLSEFSLTRLNKSDLIIEVGYKEAKKVLEEYFKKS